MISHQRKFLFLHIPKTAGITVMQALDRACSVDDQFKSGHPIYDKYLEFFGQSIKEYFSFCLVRNPWDRLVSVFHYLQNGGRNNKDAKRGEILKDYNFQSFVHNFSFEKFSYVHFKPQMHFIKSVDNFDYIGRLENLQNDFNTICDKIGIPQQQLPHKNKSHHKHYTEYYDEETREIIAQKYAKDIEYFGYEFGEQ